jgi:hypothetical protein
MSKKIPIILALVLMVLYVDMGRTEDEWDLPFDQVFEANVVYPNIDLEVQIVDDANAVCKQYANDINYQVKHCALQYRVDANGARKCVLVMDERYLTLGDIGHEVRHCFEGEWHEFRPTRGVKR